MKRICSFAVLVMVALVSMAPAQSIQQGAITWNQNIFTNQDAPATSSTVRNIGQAAHWVTYCPNASVATISIQLEASYDGSTWFRISNVGTSISTACDTLEAGGYFPYIRVHLNSITGVGAKVTVQYSSSIFPVPGTTALNAVRDVTGSGLASTVTIDQSVPGTSNGVVVNSGSVGVTSITNALPAGSNIIGKFTTDQTTPGTTDLVHAAQSGTWNIGTLTSITNAVTTNANPTTASAAALTSSVKATLTTSVNVKASPGNVYGVLAQNGAASLCWVQFINSAGAGTLGTGVVFAVPLAASGISSMSPGDVALSNFSTGIAVGIATTANGNTACGTAGNVTVFYQ